jgi:endogenous inhibitor of DNA gyrase (YacG/DUF329 family)
LIDLGQWAAESYSIPVREHSDKDIPTED